MVSVILLYELTMNFYLYKYFHDYRKNIIDTKKDNRVIFLHLRLHKKQCTKLSAIPWNAFAFLICRRKTPALSLPA